MPHRICTATKSLVKRELPRRVVFKIETRRHITCRRRRRTETSFECYCRLLFYFESMMMVVMASVCTHVHTVYTIWSNGSSTQSINLEWMWMLKRVKKHKQWSIWEMWDRQRNIEKEEIEYAATRCAYMYSENMVMVCCTWQTNDKSGVLISAHGEGVEMMRGEEKSFENFECCRADFHTLSGMLLFSNKTRNITRRSVSSHTS